MNLKVDPDRLKYADGTGIYCRAQLEERWGTHDFATLDKASVLEFLRSRDGDNPWAEDICGILLGHGPLHPT